MADLLSATEEAYFATWTRIDELERLLSAAASLIREMHAIGHKRRHIANWHKDRIGDLQATLCGECEAAGEIAEAHR